MDDDATLSPTSPAEQTVVSDDESIETLVPTDVVPSIDPEDVPLEPPVTFDPLPVEPPDPSPVEDPAPPTTVLFQLSMRSEDDRRILAWLMSLQSQSPPVPPPGSPEPSVLPEAALPEATMPVAPTPSQPPESSVSAVPAEPLPNPAAMGSQDLPVEPGPPAGPSEPNPPAPSGPSEPNPPSKSCLKPCQKAGCQRQKFIPRPGNRAEERLREQLDKKNAREAKRKARKKEREMMAESKRQRTEGTAEVKEEPKDEKDSAEDANDGDKKKEKNADNKDKGKDGHNTWTSWTVNWNDKKVRSVHLMFATMWEPSFDNNYVVNSSLENIEYYSIANCMFYIFRCNSIHFGHFSQTHVTKSRSFSVSPIQGLLISTSMVCARQRMKIGIGSVSPLC